MSTLNEESSEVGEKIHIFAETIDQILNRGEDIPTKDISNGLVDYSLRCLKGIHRGKFLYLNLTPEGEMIGGDPNDPALTLYMENSNLDNRHIQIISKNCCYYLKDLNSSTGTFTKQGNDDPILIRDGMIMQINSQFFQFTFGEDIEDTVQEWLKKYGISEYTQKAHQMGCTDVSQLVDLNVSACWEIIPNKEDNYILSQAIRDFKIDLGPGHIKNRLLIKNQDKNDSTTVGWAGVTIGNSENCDINLDWMTNKNLIQNQVSQSECQILYQFGKYWVANSKNYPIKDLYLKLEGGGEGDKGHEIRPGDTIKIGQVTLKVNRFNVGKAEDRGSKHRVMEDKSVIIQDLNVSENIDFSFFAVFDGHGGTLCVRHVAEYLPSILREYLLKSASTDIGIFDNQEKFYSFIKEIIVQSIKDTDFSFFDESGDYSLDKGCTGVIVMIIGDRIICANVGDSRAILSRRRSPICLSKDHKPNNPAEKNRILLAGGKVEADRVNGVLATSRSFGDFKFKVVSHYSAAFKSQGNGDDIVTSKPEIRVHKIDWSQDEFIVIGCDGLYDNLSNQEIVEFVHDKLSDYEIGQQDSQKVISELVQHAKKTNLENTNTCDNISAILIPLTRGISKLK